MKTITIKILRILLLTVSYRQYFIFASYICFAQYGRKKQDTTKCPIGWYSVWCTKFIPTKQRVTIVYTNISKAAGHQTIIIRWLSDSMPMEGKPPTTLALNPPHHISDVRRSIANIV